MKTYTIVADILASHFWHTISWSSVSPDVKCVDSFVYSLRAYNQSIRIYNGSIRRNSTIWVYVKLHVEQKIRKTVRAYKLSHYYIS